jgi:hypothetical protein
MGAFYTSTEQTGCGTTPPGLQKKHHGELSEDFSQTAFISTLKLTRDSVDSRQDLSLYLSDMIYS